ncbi:Hsp33 family molecular chaperone HslO [Mycoplasma todarodis]|uniref:Hsp33 family molecular chaperone HslO n=1 Tax=Mycoplasma todarodis TaxID=1937191 RepID=UPI003B2C0082
MAKVQLLTKNNIRIYVSNMTDVANVAVEKHEALPLGALILATSIAVFGPLTAIKRNTKNSAILNGDGSTGTVIVESTEEGFVRASIANPKVVTEYDKTRPNDLPLGVGIGQVGTLKILNTAGDLTFGGEVKLAKGDVVTDMAYYFEKSEQTRTAVLSSVLLGENSHVERAYGVTMQMLPGYTEEDVQWVEQFLKKNKLGEMELEEFVSNMEAIKLEEKELIWKCSCSKEKFQIMFDSIPADEKAKIIKEHGAIEIKCNFCREKSTFK